MTTRCTIKGSASLLTIFLIASGAAAVAADTTVPQPAVKAPIETRIAGVFTGDFVNGMRVYRLPPVSVIGHRKAELANMDRAEQPARVKQVRSKTATKRPA